MSSIRSCRDDERATILMIVNAAAEAYRGVISEDCFHEPYMPLNELEIEIAAGVAFWGYEANGALIGVMGIQPKSDVDLIAMPMCCLRTSTRASAVHCSNTSED